MLKRSLMILFPLVLAVVLVACSSSPEKKVFTEKCKTCHSLKVITNKNYDEYKWNVTIKAMKSRGMKTTDEQDAMILRFLVENHGPKK